MGDPIAILEEAVTDGQEYLYTGAKVVETVTTEAELNAKLADPSVQIIKLGNDIVVDGYLNVTRDVTIHGNNHKITRSV
ncbi:pectate lyase-like adhesive domain-containing protein, partial [Anaerobacillus sp. MEB173]|uniref:pectate lyase-like adhesive domain-containing protein n=1 Tax=Anaerobacillus sp. MEB173 TaxID=3383345 RepID=UPI003F9328A4